MTQPLRKYRSPDVPEFSSYPAEPERASAQVIEFSLISEFDAMPEMPGNAYEEQARKIGTALGHMVNAVNKITSPVQSLVSKQYARVEDEVSLARDAAEHTFEDATRRTRKMARQSLREARARAALLRQHALNTVNDHPVQTLAAIGAAGVLAGVGLRVWSESRD